MSDLNQLLLGALAALFSAVIIFGSMILAFTEGGQTLAMVFTPTNSPSPLPPVDTPKPGEPTFTPSPTSLPSATPEPVVVENCPMPEGWVQIEVLPGDTLEGIARRYTTSQAVLQAGNCLQSSSLIPGTFLSVPSPPPTQTASATATPTATQTPEPSATRRTSNSTCGPPAGWKLYTVKRKDTLYSISRAYYTTVAALKSANCLTSNVIRVGQRLYVPNVSPRPPAVTPTATPKPKTPTSTSRPSAIPTLPSPTPGDTDTPVPPTEEPTATLAPTTEVPPTNTPTNTPEPTDTPDPTNPPQPTNAPETQAVEYQASPTPVPE